MAVLAGTAAGRAADLTVTVHDSAGQLVPHAAVALMPPAGADLSGWTGPTLEMKQEHTLFAPFVLAVGTGGTVSFPNFDEFRHHVYSFSKPKPFELRLYGQDETKTVTFDKAGVVALGCNIHDNMLAYIYVTAAPVYGVTGADGTLTLKGLPAGHYDLTVWHPDLSGAAATAGAELAEGTMAMADVAVALRSVRRVQQPSAEEAYQ